MQMQRTKKFSFSKCAVNIDENRADMNPRKFFLYIIKLSAKKLRDYMSKNKISKIKKNNKIKNKNF